MLNWPSKVARKGIPINTFLKIIIQCENMMPLIFYRNIGNSVHSATGLAGDKEKLSPRENKNHLYEWQ